MHNQIFSMSGVDGERSETEGVGRHRRRRWRM